MDLRILQRAPTATAITTPSMLAKLTIHNASLLARAAPIRMGVFKLQPTSTRFAMAVTVIFFK